RTLLWPRRPLSLIGPGRHPGSARPETSAWPYFARPAKRVDAPSRLRSTYQPGGVSRVELHPSPTQNADPRRSPPVPSIVLGCPRFWEQRGAGGELGGRGTAGTGRRDRGGGG